MQTKNEKLKQKCDQHATKIKEQIANIKDKDKELSSLKQKETDLSK